MFAIAAHLSVQFFTTTLVLGSFALGLSLGWARAVDQCTTLEGDSPQEHTRDLEGVMNLDR
jgi:hypothetical protein